VPSARVIASPEAGHSGEECPRWRLAVTRRAAGGASKLDDFDGWRLICDEESLRDADLEITKKSDWNRH